MHFVEKPNILKRFCKLPKNTSYVSVMFEIFKEAPLEKVVFGINASDVNCFTFKADGKHDATNVGSVSNV